MKQWKKYIPAAVCAVLMVLLVLLGNGRGARRWDDMHLTRLVFPEGMERSGEPCGVINEGPALTLQAGWYTLSWDIETDGANAIELTSTNGAAISPARIELTPGQSGGTVRFHALDPIYNLQVLVRFDEGTYLRVNRVGLAGDANTDRLFLCLFALTGIALLDVLWACGWLTPRRRGELILIGLAVLIAIAPTLKDNLGLGPDSAFHLDRLLNMLNALRSGQFPARLGAYSQNHYGAVTSSFYPELFLYIPAAMMLANASLNFSMHVFFILITVTAALAMRCCAGRLMKSGNAGVLASILYTLSAYRLTDMYTRFSVGESLAMAFLPLFVLGLYEVVLGEKRRWKLLAFSGMAIFQSHLITAVLCGLAAVAVCAVFIVRIVRERRLGAILLAAAAALGLCLYALIPMVTNSLSGVSTSMMPRWTTGQLISPAQLLLSMDGMGGDPADGTLKGFSLVIGLPLLVGAAAALYAAATRERRAREDRLALLLVAVGACAALMTTTLCPWARLEQLTGGLVSYIQFPWRLLMVTTLCFALAGGYGLSRLFESQALAAQFAALTLCAAVAMPMLTEETRKDAYLEAGHVPAWDQIFEDYTLTGTVISQTKDMTVHTLGDVELTDCERFGTRVTAQVASAAGGTVELPLFAFEGYEARLCGEAVEIARGENNRIAVTIPAGTQGELSVRFVGRTVWRVGEAVSLATALAMAGDALKKRKRGA